MKENIYDIGNIHSINTAGTVDGPGVRFVLFLQGCPLRCIYCHNPDTWDMKINKKYSVEEIEKLVLKNLPFYKNGGVTISGGEPLCQIEFLLSLFKTLKKHNIHIALDTSGCIFNDNVKELLKYVDLVLLDIKFTLKDDYYNYTKGNFDTIINFLEYLNQEKIDTTIRNVIINGINDDIKDIEKLNEILLPYDNITNIELLPYHNMALEKYKKLNIEYALKDAKPTSNETMEKLRKVLK